VVEQNVLLGVGEVSVEGGSSCVAEGDSSSGVDGGGVGADLSLVMEENVPSGGEVGVEVGSAHSVERSVLSVVGGVGEELVDIARLDGDDKRVAVAVWMLLLTLAGMLLMASA
jgi:hypothetical protein